MLECNVVASSLEVYELVRKSRIIAFIKCRTTTRMYRNIAKLYSITTSRTAEQQVVYAELLLLYEQATVMSVISRTIALICRTAFVCICTRVNNIRHFVQ